MSRYYLSKSVPERGYYEIEQQDGQYRYRWAETAKGIEYEDFGPWEDSRELALLDAADDWDDNGDGSRRLSGTLSAAAKRAHEPGDPS